MAESRYNKESKFKMFLRNRGWCVLMTISLIFLWIMGWCINNNNPGYGVSSGISAFIFLFAGFLAFMESES